MRMLKALIACSSFSQPPAGAPFNDRPFPLPSPLPTRSSEEVLEFRDDFVIFHGLLLCPEGCLIPSRVTWVGFDMNIDAFAQAQDIPMTFIHFEALFVFYQGWLETHLTYMNLSGESIDVALQEGVNILKTKGLTDCARSTNTDQKCKHVRLLDVPV
ncbi:uncharacterized protein LOC121974582 isoform X4 [Zingiber officinale]|uniref:uncharacterized protein LOC121974582 isoform X4 n=1 Tax=Zingiber officinale TaxID=94328 RepID=UPI001C4AAC76|nr:uncharacterized protein LOC121974582 isoform X4 [Zingiber officinale]